MSIKYLEEHLAPCYIHICMYVCMCIHTYINATIITIIKLNEFIIFGGHYQVTFQAPLYCTEFV